MLRYKLTFKIFISQPLRIDNPSLHNNNYIHTWKLDERLPGVEGGEVVILGAGAVMPEGDEAPHHRLNNESWLGLAALRMVKNLIIR